MALLVVLWVVDPRVELEVHQLVDRLAELVAKEPELKAVVAMVPINSSSSVAVVVAMARRLQRNDGLHLMRACNKAMAISMA